MIDKEVLELIALVFAERQAAKLRLEVKTYGIII